MIIRPAPFPEPVRPARSRIPVITVAAGGARGGRQRGQAFAQDLFPSDLGVSVGGALFGVSVDRAQQRIDVEEHLGIGSGQRIHPPAQAGEVFPQYRFQLAGMAEGELSQQCSLCRGRVGAAEEGLHSTRAHDVDIGDESAPEHIAAISVASLGAGFAAPDLIRASARVTLVASRSGSPVWVASAITGTSPAHDTRLSSSNTAESGAKLWQKGTGSAFRSQVRLLCENSNHPVPEALSSYRHPPTHAIRRWIEA